MCGTLHGTSHGYRAIENGPVEIVSCPIENGGSFHSYVKLPEGPVFRSGLMGSKSNGFFDQQILVCKLGVQGDNGMENTNWLEDP